MKTVIVAQAFTSFEMGLTGYLIVALILFLITVYIIRAIFNIPTIVRYHKAQVRLLEEIAKKQGVDDVKVQGIITETAGWGEN